VKMEKKKQLLASALRGKKKAGHEEERENGEAAISKGRKEEKKKGGNMWLHRPALKKQVMKGKRRLWLARAPRKGGKKGPNDQSAFAKKR